ncbi:hypothetical protein [Geodermatophilus sp. DSM 44513]|uniref:hypothetical protein n=1 Tax=Geodermatophilus sp. DSM 44513 TaxID=1528104 RepID=UPI00126E9CE7|nr:hypothetical protein [Geodermatophilus sp. DSM 44513]WNV75510.1 hypothetical protein RTG05_21430 [Geodermatophilus sp. DSM 44513]
MTGWLARARWWQVGLLVAPLPGTVFGLMERFARDESWTHAVAFGAVTGLLCGGIVGAIAQTRLQEDAGDLPPETYARLDRAARRGPVPGDPDERAAALDLLLGRLSAVRASRTPSAVLMSGLLLFTVAAAVTRSPWWWVGTAVCAVLLVLAVRVVPRRLERRAGQLAEPPG